MSEFEKKFPESKDSTVKRVFMGDQRKYKKGWLEHGKLILERIEQGQEDMNIREYLIDEIEELEK